jgi:hypothetical protein
VLGDCEQGREPVLLLAGEEVGAGVQHPAGGIQRITGAAAVAVQVLLDPAAAAVQGVTGQADHVEGVHDRRRVRQLFGGGGLEAGEPVHRDHLHAVTPGGFPLREPLLEGLFRAAFDHVQQPRRAGAVPHSGEVDDHGDEPLALSGMAGVPPHVFVHADHAHAVEPCGVVDEHSPALGQDCVVGRVPGDGEGFGDTRDGEVLDHERFQRPPQPPPRQLRPRLGCAGGVLAPHVPATAAPVAADPDLQDRGPPAQRLVRQPPQHRAAGHAPAAAPPAPGVRLHDPARQHCPTRLDPLTDDLQAERVEPTERGQVRTIEGSVRHVEVFRMSGVGTFILGRPRPLSPNAVKRKWIMLR